MQAGGGASMMKLMNAGHISYRPSVDRLKICSPAKDSQHNTHCATADVVNTLTYLGNA